MFLRENKKRLLMDIQKEILYQVMKFVIFIKKDIQKIFIIILIVIQKENILRELLDGKIIEELFLEFDKRETKEAIFAYQCDKLECDIQCKLYDQEHCVDLNHQEGNNVTENEKVRKLLHKGESWSSMWIKFGQETYPYDENFRAVSDYALNNQIESQTLKLTQKNNKNN